MSTLTHRQRSVARSNTRRKERSRASVSRPYIVMNGAIMVSIAAIAITLIGILYLIQTAEVAQLGYDLSRLQDRRESLTMEISELEYDVARYQSLGTVEGVATDDLGMTEMTNYEFIKVQEPAQRELTLPEPERFEDRSFFQRIQDALLGVGSANSVAWDGDGTTTDEVGQ